MKKYWFQSQSSHSLTLQGIIFQSSHLFQQQPPAKSYVQTILLCNTKRKKKRSLTG
ncbi:hypothetical protein DPMN_075219 [Dreissena polymorpha]|uniref:Uncharacterized protein n=1 Tax=Dreissena polymorpha TaxID=45954 RepID=A0A9D4BMF6_DREPO|nr:hypothetical protein DPMN_075219 [Dreissena polymorpha]